MFPRTEIQFPICDRDDNFAAHDLTLEMGVGVIFAGAIVLIAAGRIVRSEFFQPNLIIVMQARFVVVDEYRRRDVHGVDQTKTFTHTATLDEFLDLRRDVDEPASIRYFKQRCSVNDFMSEKLMHWLGAWHKRLYDTER